MKPRCARWSTHWAWTTRRSALQGLLPSVIYVEVPCGMAHIRAVLLHITALPHKLRLRGLPCRIALHVSILLLQCSCINVPLYGDRMDSGLL